MKKTALIMDGWMKTIMLGNIIFTVDKKKLIRKEEKICWKLD